MDHFHQSRRGGDDAQVVGAGQGEPAGDRTVAQDGLGQPFAVHPTSVRRARHAVAESLQQVLQAHLGDDLGLLTSELVTNAIRHGACREDEDLIELVLWPADGHYWLAASTPGTGKPALAHPDTDSESGRGLILVDSLATAWTVRPRPTRGTSVIAGLSVHKGGRTGRTVSRAGREQKVGWVRPPRRRCPPPGGSSARPPGAHSG
ncbi:ATP-binding protein [Streptomyces hebeiensis]|uniref:ATP-binding protein n=1 Tax=Streptomyces hebeiensis TaxID=229486 RepID=UPI0031CF1157